VFIDVRPGISLIAIIVQQKLLFYNLMQYNKPMDLLYYITSAINLTDTESLDLPLFISGAITSDSLLINKMDPFLRILIFYLLKVIL